MFSHHHFSVKIDLDGYSLNSAPKSTVTDEIRLVYNRLTKIDDLRIGVHGVPELRTQATPILLRHLSQATVRFVSLMYQYTVSDARLVFCPTDYKRNMLLPIETLTLRLRRSRSSRWLTQRG